MPTARTAASYTLGRVGESTHQTFVAQQRERVLAVLRRELAGVDRVALVGFPDHDNVGDSAIWVGTSDALRALGVSVGYAATWWSYSAEHLRRAVDGGPVIILGGGNLGDRYLHEQQLRERVLRDHRDRRVIQMPQTVGFADSRFAQRFARLALRHPHLKLYVRDAESREMLSQFGVPSTEAPDTAFAMDIHRLHPWPAPFPETSVLWLARTDGECRSPAGEFGAATGVRMLDWPDAMGALEGWPDGSRAAVQETEERMRSGFVQASLGQRALRRALRRTGREKRYPATGRSTRFLGDLDAFAGRLNEMAEYRVARGLGLLASAQVVVTDRLHAHLMSVILGVPSLVYDNIDRKLSRYWETWPPPSAVATWTDGPESAWAALAADGFVGPFPPRGG